MGKIIREFISEEKRNYKFKLGNKYASGLSGFVFGALFAFITIAGTVLIVYLYELSAL